MPPALTRSLVGKVLVAVGAVGAVASIVATVVGLRFFGELGAALDGSVELTAGALATLDETVVLAEETAAQVEEVLAGTAATSGDVATAIEDASLALEGVADLSEREVADSLAAVERSLPALIDVAAVIDRTLGTLSGLPFGPDYDPDEPFDDSLRAIQREMEGLPEGLRDQAALIRVGQESLADVGQGIDEVSRDLAEMTVALHTAGTLLGDYASATSEARQLVADSDDRLDGQIRTARWLTVTLGVAFLVGQIVPIGVGWFLLRPEAARAFLDT